MSSIFHPKNAFEEAFVRATRPSVYGLVLKQIIARKLVALTVCSSLGGLNWPGKFGSKSATPTVG